MELHNDDRVTCVIYEDAAFLETCDQAFAGNSEFIVACDYDTVTKCRAAASLFLEYEFRRPKGLARLTLLAKLGLAGMRVAPLMAVCNKAILRRWMVTLRSDENRVLHIKPRSDFGPTSQ